MANTTIAPGQPERLNLLRVLGPLNLEELVRRVS